jgi:hypothetical protein
MQACVFLQTQLKPDRHINSCNFFFPKQNDGYFESFDTPNSIGI